MVFGSACYCDRSPKPVFNLAEICLLVIQEYLWGMYSSKKYTFNKKTQVSSKPNN